MLLQRPHREDADRVARQIFYIFALTAITTLVRVEEAEGYTWTSWPGAITYLGSIILIPLIAKQL